MREAIELPRIREALKLLNFSDHEIWDIFEVSAAVLHLGNLEYTSNTIGKLSLMPQIMISYFKCIFS